ncbi:competence protein CoiA [Psychrobacillus glaciei]|uniref:competence protein CoiA n=1 Tax=Psychrobacillus glaciei TaxID=2283160 RepID=UPI00178C372C|nr:competence protein CoiA family protein [Psychrobacillus glaciei]
MFIILTAVTKHGHLFIPARYSTERLMEIKNSTTFLCIQCQEEVILKNGMINIPHFAHKRKSECSYSFSEGETEEHLIGKLQLYDLFKRLHVKAQLEPFLPSIKQRPDILISWKETMFAIEFQCSQISSYVINERSKGYRGQTILPIWILRTPLSHEFPPHEIGIMKLSAFKQQFFTSNPTFGQTIITYCPQTKYFHYISNTQHIRANTFIVKRKKLSVDNQTWPFALVKRISKIEYETYLKIYRSQRFRHLENLYFHNKKGIQSPFLQVCYRWQVYPKKLPSFIGIPTSHSKAFHVHAVEWQIQLIDYLNSINVPIHQVTETHCESFLYARLIGPVESGPKLKAVQAYIHLLQSCVIKSDSVVYLSKMNFSKMNELLYRDFLAN